MKTIKKIQKEIKQFDIDKTIQKTIIEFLKSLDNDYKSKNFIACGNKIRQITENIVELLFIKSGLKKRPDTASAKIRKVSEIFENKIQDRGFYTHLMLTKYIGDLFSHPNGYQNPESYIFTGINSLAEIVNTIKTKILKIN